MRMRWCLCSCQDGAMSGPVTTPAVVAADLLMAVNGARRHHRPIQGSAASATRIVLCPNAVSTQTLTRALDVSGGCLPCVDRLILRVEEKPTIGAVHWRLRNHPAYHRRQLHHHRLPLLPAVTTSNPVGSQAGRCRQAAATHPILDATADVGSATRSVALCRPAPKGIASSAPMTTHGYALGGAPPHLHHRRRLLQLRLQALL